MKIVDLFGCGVPVCAVRFDAVDEVVKDDVNGIIFDTSDDLYQALIQLLSNDDELERLRTGVRDLAWRSWADEWDKTAKAVFS